MGNLLELVVSFGLFAACLAGGVLAIYNNLVSTQSLYESPVETAYVAGSAPRTQIKLELSSRLDAAAYAAFIQSAKNFGGPTCSSYLGSLAGISGSIAPGQLQSSVFGLAAQPLDYPATGYAVTFRQLSGLGTSASPAVFASVNTVFSTQSIIAQLRRNSVNGVLLAEALVRCSVSQV